MPTAGSNPPKPNGRKKNDTIFSYQLSSAEIRALETLAWIQSKVKNGECNQLLLYTCVFICTHVQRGIVLYTQYISVACKKIN